MNKSPWIFLGVLFALSLSWWGMVFGPAAQVNAAKSDLGDGTALHPRSGLAQQGEQIYRANGCYYCHTRTATGGTFGYELQLTQLGEDQDLTAEIIGEEMFTVGNNIFNRAYEYKALAKALDALKAEEEKENGNVAKATEQKNKAITLAKGGNLEENLVALGVSGVSFDTNVVKALELPLEMTEVQQAKVANAVLPVTHGTESWDEIEDKVRGLKDRAGAQFKLLPKPKEWPDVENGTASRQSVSRDYLFDTHAMPGVMRMGPDLSNVGARRVSANELYAKIYNAQAGGVSSHMPPFKYLFNVRPLKDGEALPNGAVTLADGASVEENHVVTPNSKARALVAYLQSLRNDRSLPEAPLPGSIQSSKATE